MQYILNMAIGALLITAGYFLCYFTVKQPSRPRDIVTEVKRVKPSLRNPLKTYEVAYDKYKSRDTGLYEPQKPKRGDS